MAPYFDDVEMGDELPPQERPITDQAVVDFCLVWQGPGASRFTDHERATAEGLSAAITPGVMCMTLMAQFLEEWAGAGSVRKLDVVFRQNVLHGPVRLVGVVTDTSAAGGGLVECDVSMQSLEGELLVGGGATLALPSRS